MDTQEIPIPVQVIVGGAFLPIDLFLQLEIGDILILDQPIRAPLAVKFGENKQGQGFPGLVGPYKAIQMESFSHD